MVFFSSVANWLKILCQEQKPVSTFKLQWVFIASSKCRSVVTFEVVVWICFLAVLRAFKSKHSAHVLFFWLWSSSLKPKNFQTTKRDRFWGRCEDSGLYFCSHRGLLNSFDWQVFLSKHVSHCSRCFHLSQDSLLCVTWCIVALSFAKWESGSACFRAVAVPEWK